MQEVYELVQQEVQQAAACGLVLQRRRLRLNRFSALRLQRDKLWGCVQSRGAPEADKASGV